MTTDKRFVQTLLAALLVGGIVVMLLLVALQSDWMTEDILKPGSPRRNFLCPIGEQLVVYHSGYRGIRMIECAEIKIAKRKLGFLTLGAFNVLKMKDLRVVLPDDLLEKEKSTGGQSEVSGSMARAFVKRLGISQELLKGRTSGVRFSGLEIDGLNVSELDARTNVVFRFSAEQARLTSDGLKLKGCEIVENEIRRSVGEAMLIAKPQLSLRWSNGEMNFNTQGDKK